MKRLAIVAAGIASAVLLVGTTADALPGHRSPVAASAAPQVALPAATPAAKVSRTRTVRIARSQLGYTEHGANCTKYGPCEEWCSLFATWVWRRAGVRIPSYAFTGDVYRWGQHHHRAYGKASLRRARAGDVLLFGTGPATTRTSTHTGIVERVAGRRVTLIEGNSGNRVRRRTYTLSARTFYGGVRP